MSTLYFILFFTIVSFAIGFKYLCIDDDEKKYRIGITATVLGCIGLLILYIAAVQVFI